MILTPIPLSRLGAALDSFARGIEDDIASAAFAAIRETEVDRAEGLVAEHHRQQALAVAAATGMAIYPDHTDCAFNWDGIALNAATEAYVILHEVAHFVLAPAERRALPDFGLGPGPDTISREAAEQAAIVNLAQCEADEAEASLYGILLEASLGQPALASFLDQNWLEGLERFAQAHFSAITRRLEERRLIGRDGMPALTI